MCCDAEGPADDCPGAELVAQTPDRDDALRRVGGGPDLRPELLDVHVERLGVADIVVAAVDQGLPGHDDAGVLHQQREELELLQRQLHEFAGDRDRGDHGRARCPDLEDRLGASLRAVPPPPARRSTVRMRAIIPAPGMACRHSRRHRPRERRRRRSLRCGPTP